MRRRGPSLWTAPAHADHREVCTMSRYQEFDAQIFETTKIMIGFTLTEEQEAELLQIAGEIEGAYQDGTLSGDERQRLLDTMADCGLELPQPPAEPEVQPEQTPAPDGSVPGESIPDEGPALSGGRLLSMGGEGEDFSLGGEPPVLPEGGSGGPENDAAPAGDAGQEIQFTVEKLEEGYRHQLDALYRADTLDIETEIRVMETMLQRDLGSVEKDFKL